MKRTFRPGYNILVGEYDQPSSGGQVIDGPTNPDEIFCDGSGVEYYYLTADETDDPHGAGYYYIDPETDLETYYGPGSDGLVSCG